MVSTGYKEEVMKGCNPLLWPRHFTCKARLLLVDSYPNYEHLVDPKKQLEVIEYSSD